MDSKKALSLSPALSGNPLGGGKKTTAVRAIVSAQLSRTTQASQRRRARNAADRLETSLCSGLFPAPTPSPRHSLCRSVPFMASQRRPCPGPSPESISFPPSLPHHWLWGAALQAACVYTTPADPHFNMKRDTSAGSLHRATRRRATTSSSFRHRLQHASCATRCSGGPVQRHKRRALHCASCCTTPLPSFSVAGHFTHSAACDCLRRIRANCSAIHENGGL